MAGNMLLKMGQRAVEKKYSGKSQQSEKPNKSRGKKVDSFHYWGPRIEMRKDGQLFVNEKKVGAHSKDTAYFESLGIPHDDARLLSAVKKQARWLDGGFTVPIVHTKFGVSALFGLVPVAGDALDGILAMAIVTQASRVSGGLDGKLRSKMVKNVILEIVIGLTPMLGDFADIFFRCSTKNANLLEEMLLNRVKYHVKPARDAEKMGPATTHGRADPYDRYNTQARPVTPPRSDEGHGGLRQRTPAQATQYQVKKTQASGRDKGWLGRVKARAQDVGAVDNVVPVRRTTRPQEGERF